MGSEPVAVATPGRINGSSRRSGSNPKLKAWVINLRAAMTTLRAEVVPYPGYEHLRVFEVSGIEDGRPRHRLRLGYFATRAEAEAVLPNVRDRYPAAFATAARREDLAHGAGFDWQSLLAAARRASAESAPASTTAVEPAMTDTQVLRLLDPGETPPAIDPDASGIRRSSVTITAPSAPIELSLVDERAPQSAASPGRPANSTPQSSASDWFAVELISASRPPTRRDVPQLDIFAAFALYPIQIERNGETVHAVRLGFFRERLSAEQVASYVRSTYPDVSVVGVSAEEQMRRVALAGSRGIDTVEVHTPASNVIPLPRAPEHVPIPASVMNSGQFRAWRNVNGKRPPSNRIDPTKTGRHRRLADLLAEEAEQVKLTESAIRKMSKQKQSLLGRLMDRLKR